MASGSYQSSTGVNCNIKLMWSSQPDVASNTSTVTVTVQLLHHALYMGTRTLNIHCMGLNKSVAVPAISTGATSLVTTTIGNVTFTVPHNADGTMSGTISAEMPQFNVTYGGKYLASLGCSGTATLDTIPRASQLTLSADSVEMGDTLTITINRASEAFTHSLYYYFGELMYEPIPAEIVDDVCVWTVPKDLAYQIPNATEGKGKGKILLETYNSEGVIIGAVPAEFTAVVPEDITPSINEIICTGQAFNEWMVQGKSQLGVEVDASGAYGSTIVSYRITANGGTYTYNNCNAGLLQKPGTYEVTAEVTDSRGRTATGTTTYYVVEYATPTIHMLKASRCDADFTLNDEGEYILLSVSADIAPVNNVNRRIFLLEYKASTDTEYTTIQEESSTYSYNPVFAPIAANPDNAYTVRLTATDAYTTVAYTVVVPTAFTLMDFNASGKGVAFGKVSEKDAFECAMPAEFEDVTFMGDVKGLDIDEYNLLTGTDFYDADNNSNFMLYNGATIDNTEGCAVLGAISTGLAAVQYELDTTVEIGKEYTFSAEVKSNTLSGGTIGIFYRTLNEDGSLGMVSTSLPVSTAGKIKWTFTPQVSKILWIQVAANRSTSGTLKVGSFKLSKGNTATGWIPSFADFALKAQCVQSEYTVHSNTDTYFCESYKYSDGRLVINQRQLVDVNIDTASGGIYWGNASLNDYPVEFESMPTVTLSTMTGTINAFIWGNYGTELPSTTNPGKPLLGRGEAASGKVWVCVHSEGRYAAAAASEEVMNISEDDIL